MVAKIKKHPDPKDFRYRHKPRNISTHTFDKAYWPYLPLILLVGALVTLNFRGGSLPIKTQTASLPHVSTASSTTAINAYLADSNTARLADKESSLNLNPQLQAAAQAKADDMAQRNYWSHDTPEGNQPWIFVNAQGYSYQKLGENLAAGFSGPQSVVNAWMTSASQQQNLLDPAYSDAGFGVAYSPNYTSAGKGPMFVVVAFYGQPSGASTPVGNSPTSTQNTLTANTQNPLLGSLASAKTSRAQLALAWLPSSSWVTDAAFGLLIAACTVWITRHVRKITRTFKQGEKYVIKHIWLDVGLIAVIVLCYLLIRTAGFIQ